MYRDPSPPPVYKHDFRQLLQQYFELIRPRRKLFLLAAILITCVQACAIVESILFGKIVQVWLQHASNGWPRLIRLSLIAAGVIALASLFTLSKSILVRRTTLKTLDELTQTCVSKIMRLNGPFIETHNPTNLLGRAQKGIASTESMSWQLTNELLPLALTFIGTMIAVSFIAPVALVVLLPTILVFTALTMWARAKFVNLRKHRHALKRDANSLFGEIVYNLRTVISFNQQERLLKKHSDMEQTATKMVYTEYDFYDKVDMARGQLIGGARLSVFLVTMYFGRSNPELGGKIMILALLSERLLRACYSLGNIYDRFIDACEPMNEMVEILNEPEPIRDPVQPKSLPQVRGEISFDNVVFTYPSKADQLALANIGFTIEAGQTIGIVGGSGGGKSTIIKLILRFVDPTSGSVKLDGIDLRELRQFDLHNAIGYVPQTVDMFDGTIRENILFGAPDSDDEAMIVAAKLAHAHEFISSFPDGYASRVGDRGLRLSGGQIQRIGLARALIRNPQIILLDEATASVDVHNDAGIHRSIREIAKTGKTVIIIAHRLSTVKDADRIICLDKGKIVETGTPAELRRRPMGYFSALLATQEALDRVEAPN